MNSTTRRYDVDWLRVIAIGLLLIYHTAIGFQPWGIFIGFIQNSDSLESLWVPMSMLNIWRIPILFFVSGMGVYFAMKKRNWKALIGERTRRILVPFVFGMAAIVPVHVLILQKYYHQDLSYFPHPAHLWFLGNIFIYVLVFSPLFFYLKRVQESAVGKRLKKMFRTPLGLAVIVLPFIAEAELIRPESFELYAMTLHGFVLGSIAFLAGFCCVYSGEGFWQLVTRWRWPLLVLALVAYGVRVGMFDLRSPYFMMATESCIWIFALLGFTHRYLNKPNRALAYLSQAAYPVYIIHMAFLYAGSAWLFPLALDPWIKFILLNVITFGGCMLMYEFVIRRAGFLRLLFGLKPAAPRVTPGVANSPDLLSQT